MSCLRFKFLPFIACFFVLSSMCGAREWKLRHSVAPETSGFFTRQGFGVFPDMEGTRAVVGNPFEFEFESEPCPCASGAAYLFDLAKSTQTHRITATRPGDNDMFGTYATLIGDDVYLSNRNFINNSGGGPREILHFNLKTEELQRAFAASEHNAVRLTGGFTVNNDLFGLLLTDGADGIHYAVFGDRETGDERFRLPDVDKVGLNARWATIVNDNEGTVTVIDAATGDALRQLEHPDGFLENLWHGVRILPMSEEYVVIRSSDRFETRVSVFDVRSGAFISDLDIPGDAGVQPFGIDGDFAIVRVQQLASGKATAMIFDVHTGEVVFEFPSRLDGGGASIRDNMAIFATHDPDGPVGGELFVAHYTDSIVGDFDNDSVVTSSDIDLLNAVIRGGGSDFFDLNRDALVDDRDRSYWTQVVAETYFGDANLDGEFNSGDLVAVFEAGQYEDGLNGNSGWAEGDWNGDGEFSTSDLVLAFEDGGYEQGPRAAVSAVPEPSTALLLGLAAAFTASRTRRKRF